jgi:hypothetical protein
LAGPANGPAFHFEKREKVMAYNTANLEFVDFNVFGGRTYNYDADADTMANVAAYNYFGPSAFVVREKDIIQVTASDGLMLYFVNGTAPNPGGDPNATVLKLGRVYAFVF